MGEKHLVSRLYRLIAFVKVDEDMGVAGWKQCWEDLKTANWGDMFTSFVRE